MSFRLILYGLVSGLAIGAMRLNVSVDEASTLGFAVFLSVSLGIWLGLTLSVLVLETTLRWVNTLMRRTQALAQRLGIEGGSSPIPPSRSFWRGVVRFAIYSTPVWCVAFTHSVILLIVDTQMGFSLFDFHVWALLIEFALIIVSIGIQWLHLLLVRRKLTLIEQRLDIGNSASLVTERLEVAYNRVWFWMHKLTGGKHSTVSV